MLVKTRGFFFYQTIIRQDLLAKLPGASVFDLPCPCKIKLFFSQAFERETEVNLARLFRWWLLLEWLTGLGGLSTSRTVKLAGGLFEAAPIVTLAAELKEKIVVTNFFVLVFFLWFQGYHTSTEIYDVKKGYIERPYWSFCDIDDRGALEYLPHKPLRQGLDRLGRAVVTIFKQAAFMTSFPTDVRTWGGFTVLVKFSGVGGVFNQAALSAFRFQQRITLHTDALLSAKRPS